MEYKVQIKRNSRKRRFRQHWNISCPLCKFRSHVKKSWWSRAIRIADNHVVGKQHQKKLKQIKGEN